MEKNTNTYPHVFIIYIHFNWQLLESSKTLQSTQTIQLKFQYVVQGLTLSGCEQESSNAELSDRVREKDGECARAIYVASDTAGSLFTGAPNGGMVLIAGENIFNILQLKIIRSLLFNDISP